MLKDKLSNTRSSIALFLFALMTFVMFILYINFIKKFLPLSRLNAQVEEFANGNLNIKIDDYGEDEIGQIAKNFKKAIEYINELIESKNLFMRNMLHELKTPITKGRIIAESIEDVEDKEYLVPIVRPVALPEKFVRLSLEDGKILLQRIVKLGPESLYIEPLFIVDSPSSQ
jgi:two-component system OmpR family sensor kinase